jgi:hypothetical protein
MVSACAEGGRFSMILQGNRAAGAEPEANEPAAEEASPEASSEPERPAIRSAAGDFPCPYFPSDCDCGALAEAQIFGVIHTDPVAVRTYQAARHRIAVEVAISNFKVEEEIRRAEAAGRDTLARAKAVVEEALMLGAVVLCPGCSLATEKDDACMVRDRAALVGY